MDRRDHGYRRRGDSVDGWQGRRRLRQRAALRRDGTDITGGTTQVVKKGDIINIPAGTPHWIKIAPGEDFVT